MSKPDFNKIINDSFVSGKSVAELLEEMYFKGARDFAKYIYCKKFMSVRRRKDGEKQYNQIVDEVISEWQKEATDDSN